MDLTDIDRTFHLADAAEYTFLSSTQGTLEDISR